MSKKRSNFTQKPLPHNFVLQILAILFHQLLHLRINHEHTVGLITVAIVVILVILFRRVEVGKRGDLRNDGLLVSARLPQRLL